MNTTSKTTQQLARELADTLQSLDRIPDLTEALDDCGFKIWPDLKESIKDFMRAEITKKANSIKKQLQEALASE